MVIDEDPSATETGLLRVFGLFERSHAMGNSTIQDNESVLSPLSFEDGSKEVFMELDAEPRIVVNNETVEKSILPERSACTGNGNIEPYVGMEFDSVQAARNVYNDYAKSVGFGIRSNTSYRSKKNKAIISKQFVCAKEGFRRKDKSGKGDRGSRPIRREGCKAEITIKRRESGKWCITRFEKNHNHPLVSPNKVHCLRSHRRVSTRKRKSVDAFKEARTRREGFMETDAQPLMAASNEIVDKSNISVSTACIKNGNVEPYVGMEFDSVQAAKSFYSDYGRHVGFGIRSNTSYRSKKNKAIISKQFVCTKEGFRRKSRSGEGDQGSRPVIREGCKAEITIKKRDNGKWCITRFQKSHSHPLLGPNQVDYLQVHGRISAPKRKIIDAFKEAQIGVRGTTDVLRVESDGISNIEFLEKDSRNYMGKGRLSSYGIDAQILLDYFKRMQAKNPSFFYAIQVDQSQCLSNAFWLDSRSRASYSYFGDVVMFDTTYNTDQHLMPFAPFTGVNHHRQPVLFGCALLSDGSESTFEWLFKTWLEAMFGRHPISIITDQDKAMKATITRVFPKSRHCFCKWRILRKAREKLRFLYRSDSNFELEFVKCIDRSETIDVFESSWRALLDKYVVKDNEWLQSIYDDREQWAPMYLRDTFFAGISTSQISESINSFFDGYINSNTSLSEFFVQYEKALNDRCEQEIQADFFTLDDKPILKTPLPMEKEVAKIYTKEIFAIFQQEIVESLLCAVKNNGENGGIETYQVAKPDERMLYTVTFSGSETRAICSCMMLEFDGIPCRHILAVFIKVKNILTLPSHFILNRWTRNAKKGVGLDMYGVEMQVDCNESTTSRYNYLCQVAHKCAEAGAISLDVYKVALSALLEANKKIEVAVENVAMGTEIATQISENNHEANISKGSQADSSVNQETPRDLQRVKTRSPTQTSTKYKTLSDKPVKKKKMCSMCKVVGHSRPTCPMLKCLGPNIDLGQSDQEISFIGGHCSSEDNTPAMEQSDQGISFLGARYNPQDNNTIMGQPVQGLPFITFLQRQSDRGIPFVGSQCSSQVNNIAMECQSFRLSELGSLPTASGHGQRYVDEPQQEKRRIWDPRR